MKAKGKIWIGAGVVVVVLLGSMVGLSVAQHSAAESLPTYAQIQGDFDTSSMNLDNQPSQGWEDAPVTVVEFGDFKCSACKDWHTENYPQLQKDYIETGKVKFHFINYAFLDRDSLEAASAGEAIYKQSPEAFWNFYDKLYENQQPATKIWATEKYLLRFVKKNITGIDQKEFEKDLKSGTFLPNVKHDYKIGATYGVSGTPTIFVNGQVVQDNSYESLKAAVETSLSATKGIGDQ